MTKLQRATEKPKEQRTLKAVQSLWREIEC